MKLNAHDVHKVSLMAQGRGTFLLICLVLCVHCSSAQFRTP